MQVAGAAAAKLGPAAAALQRDHDLLVSSVKPTLQRLQDKTAGAPYVDFDPKAYTEGQEALSALGALGIAQLKPAMAHVSRGVQAIKAFAMRLAEDHPPETLARWNAFLPAAVAAVGSDPELARVERHLRSGLAALT